MRMCIRSKFSIVGALSTVALTAVFALSGCQSAKTAAVHPENAALAHHLEQNTVVAEWLVLGPFPNPKLDEPGPDGATRAGFGTDYLVDLGGESAAEIQPDTEIAYTEDGVRKTARTQRLTADSYGRVDLDALYHPDNDNKVAYAYTCIEAARDGEAIFFLGADDWPKVLVNGELVFSAHDQGGRAMYPRQDRFEVHLSKGVNRVLIKLEELIGGWVLVLEPVTPAGAAAIAAQQLRERQLSQLQGVTLVPKNQWEFLLWSDWSEFSELVWDDPQAVEAIHGQTEMVVRWFDADLNEVDAPSGPGRYAAYVEAVGADGSLIRRTQTFFALEPGSWEPWNTAPRVTPNADALPTGLLADGLGDRYTDDLAQAAGGIFTNALWTMPDGPVLLAGMAEWTGDEGPISQLHDPMTMDLDYHVKLKRKLLGIEHTYPALKLPARRDAPAPTLVADGPESAGMSPAVVEQLRAISQSWTDSDGLPTVICVARRGSIVFHEAFGDYQGHPTTIEDRFGLASITKTFCGLLLAQFLDQGLIHEDDPVGKFLPDFPTEGDKVVTVRQCMNHTTGLTQHGAWGGIFNPWLDNSVANGLELLNPGRTIVYNGMGMDLAAKVMEAVAGKSVVRLMQEQMFAPLDFAAETTVIDMGYGVTCRAIDLAKIGQLMLNGGSYGDRTYFSPETFARTTPKLYTETCPDLPSEAELWGSDDGYGLGIAWMRDLRPDVAEDDVPDDATILSRNTIGHGSGTYCILRVDLDNEIVVAATRVGGGEAYQEYLRQLLMAVVDGIED
jgi:CubicO group peptidase (beta-lactamase class C family)